MVGREGKGPMQVHTQKEASMEWYRSKSTFLWGPTFKEIVKKKETNPWSKRIVKFSSTNKRRGLMEKEKGA